MNRDLKEMREGAMWIFGGRCSRQREQRGKGPEVGVREGEHVRRQGHINTQYAMETF